MKLLYIDRIATIAALADGHDPEDLEKRYADEIAEICHFSGYSKDVVIRDITALMPESDYARQKTEEKGTTWRKGYGG